MNIPEFTTHVWTPAYEQALVGIYLRRMFYKLQENKWYSYSPFSETWFPTLNNQDWFDEEIKEGYLVSLETFNSPNFIPKKEVV